HSVRVKFLLSKLAFQSDGNKDSLSRREYKSFEFAFKVPAKFVMAYDTNYIAYRCSGVFLALLGGGLLATSIIDRSLGACDNTLVDVFTGAWSGVPIIIGGFVALFIGRKASRTLLRIHMIITLLSSFALVGAVAVGVLRLLHFFENTSGLLITIGDNLIMCNGSYPGLYVNENMCRLCCTCSFDGINYNLELDAIGFMVHQISSLLFIILGLLALPSSLTSSIFFCAPKTKSQPLPLDFANQLYSNQVYAVPLPNIPHRNVDGRIHAAQFGVRT
ncbi:hypothetical protein QYM36_010476, partial [Artemia franciscana]